MKRVSRLFAVLVVFVSLAFPVVAGPADGPRRRDPESPIVRVIRSVLNKLPLKIFDSLPLPPTP